MTDVDAPEYSIIIPAYNEAAQLPITLPAVREAMSAVDAIGEVIVVDNNSKDDTAQVAEQHGVTVVFEPVNMISKARNAGAKAARSPVFMGRFPSNGLHDKSSAGTGIRVRSF